MVTGHNQVLCKWEFNCDAAPHVQSIPSASGNLLSRQLRAAVIAGVGCGRVCERGGGGASVCLVLSLSTVSAGPTPGARLKCCGSDRRLWLPIINCHQQKPGALRQEAGRVTKQRKSRVSDPESGCTPRAVLFTASISEQSARLGFGLTPGRATRTGKQDAARRLILPHCAQ